MMYDILLATRSCRPYTDAHIMNINPITQKKHLFYPIAAAIVSSAVLSGCQQRHQELHAEAERLVKLLKEDAKSICTRIVLLESGQMLSGLMLTPHNDTVYLRQHVTHIEELISILEDIDNDLDSSELLELKNQLYTATAHHVNGTADRGRCYLCLEIRKHFSNLHTLIDKALSEPSPQ